MLRIYYYISGHFIYSKFEKVQNFSKISKNKGSQTAITRAVNSAQLLAFYFGLSRSEKKFIKDLVLTVEISEHVGNQRS